MKRVFDVIVILSSLLLLLPVIFIVSVMVRVKLGTPIFYTQTRPGKNAKPFKMIKFRTMTDDRDAHNCLLPDSMRLNNFGRLLRSTSLDELPELWNVVKGEMSLVGPRPLLMEYVELYNEEQYRRHDVLPGITGWAQVSGRNSISWEQKFKLDVWYVENQSFLLDLKILLLTVKKVFVREGISADGHVTIEPFKGSNND